MSSSEPQVCTSGNLATLSGRFYRAVAAGLEQCALSGSAQAGRYSRPDQPTLYLSSSEAGVKAAMIAHPELEGRRHVLTFDVLAANLFDLRVQDALEEVRRKAGDPFGDWQGALAVGSEPASWRARDWIESTGAMGLIDPSRREPGLWHLVLFTWNVADGPIVG